MSIDRTPAEDGALLQLTLSFPKGNVLTMDAMRELDELLAKAAGDAQLKAVLLQASGKHFSLGASIDEHAPDKVTEMLTTFHGLVRRVAHFEVPVVCLVDGMCLGGAFELVLASHLVLATPRAQFGCPEIKLGVFPPVFAALGDLRLPGALVERMLLTGSSIDAAEAQTAGLVTRVVSGDDPRSEALAFLREELLPLSPFALRQAASVFRRASGLFTRLDDGLALAERQYLDEVASSHDANEGLSAFVERRTPSWEGR